MSRSRISHQTLKISLRAAALVFFAIIFAISGAAHAASINVAVAANFNEPAKEIARLFESKTGHKVLLSFGATGQFYTQIVQSAPFQVFLSADQSTPKKLVDDGFAIADSLFTYAVGKIVLFSANAATVTGEQTLRDAEIQQDRNRRSRHGTLRNCGRGSDESAGCLRCANRKDRAGQQHRSDVSVRGYRQCSARLRCLVASYYDTRWLQMDCANKFL